ncbi:RNA polymerase sigma factor [uncultured Jatrophihabitans sp.]|uniref:RNA polymerase sigma factor n=1 Tax=uncultured Jatrophihabitans sp. TaxID=1610747 RepID=UPI0035CA0230
MAKAQEGYLDAFETLSERHGPMVYRVALRMLGNHHDAQDLAQDTMLAAWRSLDRFRGDSLFSTWLYRIVTRQALNRLTRGRVHQSLDLLNEIPTSEVAGDPQLSAERQATVDAVGAAVSTLPLPQRVVVVLHHFEGLSYADVAEVTHSSVASVRSHLFRGRRTLGLLLAREALGTTEEEADT